MAPPWSSVRWRAIARPSPRCRCWARSRAVGPPKRLEEACEGARGWFPGPCRSPRSRPPSLGPRAASRTRPPRRGQPRPRCETRFETICWRRSGSPAIGPGARVQGGVEPDRLRRRRPVRTASTAAVISGPQLDRAGPRAGGAPRRMWEKSSRSSMSCGLGAHVPLDALERLGGRSRDRRAAFRSTRAQPRIVDSGARSSCESMARKSSLRRLASCAAR